MSQSEIEKSLSQRIQPLVDAFLNAPWENKDFYAQWLAQTYYFVSHSTRLLALSASRFNIEKDDLHIRFSKHIAEESQHEKLALKDLKGMGCELANLPENPATSSLYQVQYYWIEHVCPESFFGYILCLEYLAVVGGPQVYQKVLKAHGANACLFLKVHAEEDVDHVEKAFKEIESLTPAILTQVLKNFSLSCSLYTGFIEEARAKARGKETGSFVESSTSV